MKATVSTTGKFLVTSQIELKGRGIIKKSTSLKNVFKYLVTEKAFEALQKKYEIEFYNSFC